jgi:tetratricopeptide (TPR) repeat protein
MTAVLPSASSTLAFAAPVMGLPARSVRNLAVAGGMALATIAVAFLVLHRSPVDHHAPIAGAAPAVTKALAAPAATKSAASAPLATLHETSHETSRAAPTILPLHPEADTPPAARASETRPARAGESADDAPARAAPASHNKVRSVHRATAHQRRYAKRERHEKHARREKRSARPTQVASRAAPSPAAEGDARATYQKGNALLFAGDAAGAVAAYRKAVELAPADPIGYRGLGLAYEQQGETQAATRALRKYLKLAPGAADREIISRRIARLSHAAGHK